MATPIFKSIFLLSLLPFLLHIRCGNFLLCVCRFCIIKYQCQLMYGVLYISVSVSVIGDWWFVLCIYMQQKVISRWVITRRAAQERKTSSRNKWSSCTRSMGTLLFLGLETSSMIVWLRYVCIYMIYSIIKLLIKYWTDIYSNVIVNFMCGCI